MYFTFFLLLGFLLGYFLPKEIYSTKTKNKYKNEYKYSKDLQEKLLRNKLDMEKKMREVDEITLKRIEEYINAKSK
jgi:hypothetical protein